MPPLPFRAPWLAVVAASLIGASGCAGVRFGGAPAAPARLGERAVQIEVPFERQAEPMLCGLAVARMVSRFHGLDLDEAQWEALGKEAREGDGVSGAGLKAAFEAKGYFAALFPGTLDREFTGVYRHLDLGRPLIVMLTHRGGGSHYVVLKGYDAENRLLAVLDPASGEAVLAESAFRRDWERANRFTFLAVPGAAKP